jgi:uncharacterized protein YjbJ (UPF0337 family)
MLWIKHSRERKMNKDIIEGNWEQVKGTVKKQWGKLTDNHLEEIEGNRQKLAGRLQELYGISREEAEKKVGEWEDQQKKL